MKQMMNEKEIRKAIDEVRSELKRKIEQWHKETDRHKKTELSKSIMHYDGRLYAYREILNE